MPQNNITNTELVGRLLKSTYEIISRRTSESYASVIIRSSLENLVKRYEFLNYITIHAVQYKETFRAIDINEDIDKIPILEIGKAFSDFFKNISTQMGKGAGFYFLREIKEDLPFQYEEVIREYGLNLDYLQLEYTTTKKETLTINITNLDVLRFTFKAIFNILEGEIGRSKAYLSIDEIVKQIKVKHNVLNYINVNDIRYVKNTNIIGIDDNINALDPGQLGQAIQTFIQEANKVLGDKGGFTFIQKIKRQLNSDYLVKLENIGVDLDILEIGSETIVKNIFKTIIDIICEFSTLNYSIVMVEEVINNYSEKYPYLKAIKFDKDNYSEEIDWINITKDINEVRPAELGRGMQKIIESIVMSLGDDAGKNFINNFKKRVGKKKLVKIEEIGVNLHMIDLKKNLIG
jgi:hypothetical protein